MKKYIFKITTDSLKVFLKNQRLDIRRKYITCTVTIAILKKCNTLSCPFGKIYNLKQMRIYPHNKYVSNKICRDTK